MNDRMEIEQIITRYIEAVNTDNIDLVPMSSDIVMLGPMIPEPIRGESAVREHLGATTPFVARMELNMSVIDDDAAAVVMEFEGLNGVRVEGAYFFRFTGGQVSYIHALFDTRPLFKGA